MNIAVVVKIHYNAITQRGANGGYLIVDADKLLTQPFAWRALKRALNSNEIPIESPDRLLGLMSTVSLEPQPIPLDVKVAMLGDRELYFLLKAYDAEFGALFKVVADFSEDVDRDDDREHGRRSCRG